MSCVIRKRLNLRLCLTIYKLQKSLKKKLEKYCFVRRVTHFCTTHHHQSPTFSNQENDLTQFKHHYFPYTTMIRVTTNGSINFQQRNQAVEGGKIVG